MSKKKNIFYLTFISSDLKKLHHLFNFLNGKLNGVFIYKNQKKIYKNKFLSLFLISIKKTKGGKVLSVLRSPHLNKKSQEQFRFCNYQMRLCLKLFDTQKFRVTTLRRLFFFYKNLLLFSQFKEFKGLTCVQSKNFFYKTKVFKNL